MFPGKNELNISSETLGQIVLSHLQKMDPRVRIEEVRVSYSGCEIRFTTDKLPEEKTIEEPSKLV